MFEFEYLNNDHKKQVLEFISFLKDKEEHVAEIIENENNKIQTHSTNFQKI